MAVQKSKPSRSKRGMRRSHDHISLKKLSQDKISEEFHIRHHITKTGFYRGKKQKNFIKNKIT
ncbi:50S ribosomal protein L32 [Buchnera aphidicola]|uniref:50S ribosomal protein L32 n=1 Tax=Buchnera aphidicola TaxID=9 RepID=UPI00094BF367|nr:50S ribosomal protein L32 [Buchnera aphidicola]